MGDWDNFFIAQIGASAALAGLVFVALSINLTKILSLPSLPTRALMAISMLIAVLFQSSLFLVPGQSSTLLGWEVLGLALVMWVLTSILQRDVMRATDKKYKSAYISHIALGQLAVAPFIVAGAVVALRGTPGVYWMPPGILLSYFVAVSEAWVLLIEINR